jgi:hypothetical protein
MSLREGNGHEGREGEEGKHLGVRKQLVSWNW